MILDRYKFKLLKTMGCNTIKIKRYKPNLSEVNYFAIFTHLFIIFTVIDNETNT